MLFALFLVGLVIPAILAAPAVEGEDNSKGKIWAVLVAGSNTYGNYRHQADVCHAYQILHKNGVPDSQIIVMMYDDIAENSQNPTKGIIINKPNGPNVYKNVPKDYTGDDVTPENFVNVLTGNSAAMDGVGSGKVLKSGPNDHVFVNFVDHGGVGLIGFPNSVMYANDLIKALVEMHKKKMYKKLVFYMEACESGSMFNKILPSNINIFATTAANPDESSYACYWDNTRQVYLGDEYSVSWMEDTDAAEKKKSFSAETLLKQYKDVVKKVADSHPQMYGKKSMKKDHVKDYLGIKSKQSEVPSEMERFKDAVSSRDVAVHTLNKRIQLATNEEAKAVLIKERDILLKGRKTVDQLFGRILAHVTDLEIDDIRMLEHTRQPLSMDMMPCYKTLVENLRQSCINISKNTYALKHLYKLANLCALEYSGTDKVLQAYQNECTDHHRALSGVN